MAAERLDRRPSRFQLPTSRIGSRRPRPAIGGLIWQTFIDSAAASHRGDRLNPAQLTALIRYHLDQLGSKNGFVDFERICFQVIKIRLCPNVIPATGPVGYRGDQGRDFETVLSFVGTATANHPMQRGAAQGGRLVFACSIGKEVRGKLKGDVRKVLTKGSRPALVYFLTNQDVPVGERHALQKWASEDESVELEILDGTAIAEWLNSPDLFWLAEQYLSIPSEAYPRTGATTEWYNECLKRWRSRAGPPDTHAELMEIKRAVRHATFTAALKVDLPTWIQRLEAVADKSSNVELGRKAIYELSVACLRGLENLHGQEPRLDRYFATFPANPSATDFEDAIVLLNYLSTAMIVGATAWSQAAWKKFYAAVLKRLDKALEQASEPTRKCDLLDVRGFAELLIDPSTRVAPKIGRAVFFWTRLVDEVGGAPLFPLDRFSDRLTQMLEFIEPTPEFDVLIKQVDKLVGKRHGGFAVAANCRDRAVVHLGKGRLVLAIKELHYAKVHWFSGDTLEGTILSTLIIANSYTKLGLHVAAKYYALAAAHIAANSKNAELKRFVPRALFSAANYSFFEGAWADFLSLFKLAVGWHFEFSPNPDAIEDHEEFTAALGHASNLAGAASTIGAEADAFVASALDESGLGKALAPLVATSRKAWATGSVSQIFRDMEKQGGGVPFCDIGNVRRIAWSALGTTWAIECDCASETVGAAEELVAAIQILQVEISDVDLWLVPSNVSIRIGKGPFEIEPSLGAGISDGRRWDIALPLGAGISVSSIDPPPYLLEALMLLLADLSLAPLERITSLLEERFKDGLGARLLVAQRYSDLFRKIISDGIYNEKARRRLAAPTSPGTFNPRTHKDLDWNGSAGPTYSAVKAKEYLQRRYETTIEGLRNHLIPVREDPLFKKEVCAIRTEGWLDWHILSAILNLAISYQLRADHPEPLGVDELMAAHSQLLQTGPKSLRGLPPLADLNRKAILFAISVNALSSLKVYGLECRQTSPDIPAILRFLAVRYRYQTDDIDHAHILPACRKRRGRVSQRRAQSSRNSRARRKRPPKRTAQHRPEPRGRKRRDDEGRGGQGLG